MSWKRPLFLLHRWMGIALCLFFALWFFSGIFMMYVEFPQLLPGERQRGLAPLDFSTARFSPAQAAQRIGTSPFSMHATPTALESVTPDAAMSWRSIRLGMWQQRPVYYFHPDTGAQPRAVLADTAEVIEVAVSDAQAVAAEFGLRAGLIDDRRQVTYLDALQVDQWTVSSALDAHRPLYRVALNDAAGTQLYVSGTTGEVVRDTARRERVLNYFGAVTHWVYPTVLRKYPDLWEWVVDVLSVVGVVLAITGLWIGVLRWRRKRAPGKPAVPYKGLMRWHYFSGAIFGVFALTWVFSGLMSMNPLSLNPPRAASSDESSVLSGAPLTPAAFNDIPAVAAANGMVEARAVMFLGQALYEITADNGTQQMVAARQGIMPRLPDAQTLLALAPQLMPGVPLIERVVLDRYDDYYYSRHPERNERLLPVVRLKFGGAQQTWFYLSPRDGQIIQRMTRTNRVYRWLYNGLHSLDFRWLLERRPLWDVLVIALSLGGLLLSVCGVWVGWRRLRM